MRYTKQYSDDKKMNRGVGVVIKKTGCFRDKECTCECGNKHELYGGVGYKTISLEGYDLRGGGGLYRKIVSCKKCGLKSEFEEKD